MGKFITIGVLVILLIFSGWFYWSYYYTYSDGNRSGLLQKFSHKGNVFKTYEGELVLNSLTANAAGPLSAEKFFFSVEDKAVATKLSTLEGQRVILHYQEKKNSLSWRGDSPYVVDSVRIMGQ